MEDDEEGEVEHADGQERQGGRISIEQAQRASSLP
jgi:hypothetical protein